MAIVAPVGGHILDRLGPRVVLSGGLFLVAAGMAVSAALSAKWHFLVGYGGLAAAGFGIGTVSAVATVIYGSIRRRSGLAVGVATSGATAGQIVLVPALAAIVTDIGWRTGYLTVALMAVALGLIGWVIAGRARDAARAAHAHTREGAVPALVSLREFARSPVFHALFWSFMVCGFTTTGVIETHLIPYAAFCGIPPVPSATIYGLLSGVNLVGMVLAGYLSDHVHRPFFLGALYIARAFTFLLLMFIGPDFELMLVFAVVFGLVDYASVPVTTSLARSHFGIGRLGLIMGLMTAGHSIGGAIGAYTGGLMFDMLGTYVWVWLAALAIALLGGLIAFTIPEPERRVPWRRRGVVAA
jgi:MFS family permease